MEEPTASELLAQAHEEQELKEAAKHYDRSAELQPAPALKTERTHAAAWCRSEAKAVGAVAAAVKAKEMAEAEAKANAAADALLAEEEEEKKAAAASSGKAQGKGSKNGKGGP